MNIIGCDLHTRYQVIAWRREETGEVVVRQLEHKSSEAREFYASLPPGARVGIEATVPGPWFERGRTGLIARRWGSRPAKTPEAIQ